MITYPSVRARVKVSGPTEHPTEYRAEYRMRPDGKIDFSTVGI